MRVLEAKSQRNWHADWSLACDAVVLTKWIQIWNLRFAREVCRGQVALCIMWTAWHSNGILLPRFTPSYNHLPNFHLPHLTLNDKVISGYPEYPQRTHLPPRYPKLPTDNAIYFFRGSSVSSVIRLLAGQPRFDSRQGQGFFFIATPSRPALGFTHPPAKWKLGS
jgi:hypothetical protein